MKSKLLPALLLSIAVIAGTTTITDAFAQTNTERLQTVVETTSDTNDVVHMIMEALSDIIASITAVDEHVHELSEEVSMSTSTITSKLSDIEQTLAGSAALSVAMQQISSDVQSVKMTVEEIDEHVMAMGDNSDLEATISDLSTSTNTRLNSLEDSINERFAAIDAQLEGISESLGVVETTVLPDPEAPAAIPALMNEVENSMIKASYFATAFSNTNADISKWPKDENNYVLPYDFTFSCDENVLIDTISVEAAGPLMKRSTIGADNEAGDGYDMITPSAQYGHPILVNNYNPGTGVTTSTITTSTITVAGRTLVDTNFEPNPGATKVVYSKDADFELMQLSANSLLQFKSMIDFRAYTDVENILVENEYDNDNLADDAEAFEAPYYPKGGVENDHDNDNAKDTDTSTYVYTYANLTSGNVTELETFDFDVFKVNVDYISLSGSNANCALSLPDVSAALSKKGTELVNLVTSGDSLLKTFEAEISCNDKPAAITVLTAAHDVNESAEGATVITLEAGGQTKEFTLEKGKIVTAEEKNDLPLKFDSGNLKISGTVPQVSGILLQVTYQTVSGNSCSEVQDSQ